jgi:hypothetical protein
MSRPDCTVAATGLGRATSDRAVSRIDRIACICCINCCSATAAVAVRHARSESSARSGVPTPVAAVAPADRAGALLEETELTEAEFTRGAVAPSWLRSMPAAPRARRRRRRIRARRPKTRSSTVGPVRRVAACPKPASASDSAPDRSPVSGSCSAAEGPSKIAPDCVLP